MMLSGLRSLNETVTMGVGEAVTDLMNQRARTQRVERRFEQQLGQRRTLTEVHHQKRDAVDLADVHHADHARMGQASRELRLAREALEELAVGEEARMEELDRVRPRQPDVARSKDGAHRSTADVMFDAILRIEDLANENLWIEARNHALVQADFESAEAGPHVEGDEASQPLGGVPTGQCLLRLERYVVAERDAHELCARGVVLQLDSQRQRASGPRDRPHAGKRERSDRTRLTVMFVADRVGDHRQRAGRGRRPEDLPQGGRLRDRVGREADLQRFEQGDGFDARECRVSQSDEHLIEVIVIATNQVRQVARHQSVRRSIPDAGFFRWSCAG